MDRVEVGGVWLYGGVRYDDVLQRITLVGPDTPPNREFMRTFKHRLKERSEQEDIWITAHAVEVI